MKTYTFVASITLVGLAAVAWTAMAEPAPAEADTSELAELRETEKRLEQAEKRVIDRLGIAPAMELLLENGKDPVEESREYGFIIEISLEEVEAALAAAAATPGIEDDIEAHRLRSQGSYRFYMDSETATGRKPFGRSR